MLGCLLLVLAALRVRALLVLVGVVLIPYERTCIEVLACVVLIPYERTCIEVLAGACCCLLHYRFVLADAWFFCPWLVMLLASLQVRACSCLLV